MRPAFAAELSACRGDFLMQTQCHRSIISDMMNYRLLSAPAGNRVFTSCFLPKDCVKHRVAVARKGSDYVRPVQSGLSHPLQRVCQSDSQDCTNLGIFALSPTCPETEQFCAKTGQLLAPYKGKRRLGPPDGLQCHHWEKSRYRFRKSEPDRYAECKSEERVRLVRSEALAADDHEKIAHNRQE